MRAGYLLLSCALAVTVTITTANLHVLAVLVLRAAFLDGVVAVIITIINAIVMGDVTGTEMGMGMGMGMGTSIDGIGSRSRE